MPLNYDTQVKSQYHIIMVSMLLIHSSFAIIQECKISLTYMNLTELSPHNLNIKKCWVFTTLQHNCHQLVPNTEMAIRDTRLYNTNAKIQESN